MVTALACFALYPNDYPQAIAAAIWQGGDTDTIAAMTGALVGAHAGSNWTQELQIQRLEEGQRFVHYVLQLSQTLAAISG